MHQSHPLPHRTASTRWLLAGLVGLLSLSASAQSWPDKPMRVVVPLPPGGPSDIVLRGAAPKVQQLLGQPLVVDNKPGANGNIGTAEAARAAGDGYTWLWTTDTTLTVNPHVYEKMAFKASDLQPVMRASSFSQTLVWSPKVGLKTVAALVKKAKATPLTYASGGAGSPGHLTTELFSAARGIGERRGFGFFDQFGHGLETHLGATDQGLAEAAGAHDGQQVRGLEGHLFIHVRVDGERGVRGPQPGVAVTRGA